MKIEIWEEKEEVLGEQSLKLRLIRTRDNASLVVVDEDGAVVPAGYLLRITSYGRLVLSSNINRSLGLCLDHSDKLRVSV